LLAQDLTSDPLVPENGFVAVRRVSPESALLTQAEPSPEDADVIIKRMQLAASTLDAAGGKASAL
jgi:hypothetical protein